MDKQKNEEYIRVKTNTRSTISKSGLFSARNPEPIRFFSARSFLVFNNTLQVLLFINSESVCPQNLSANILELFKFGSINCCGPNQNISIFGPSKGICSETNLNFYN
uniref:Uncharacterized protein n=1 Tax=Meloidogyne incognita TaxID=6306 RepID=A0A914LYA7_MELIC